MKTIINILFLSFFLIINITAQEVISVIYQGENKLSKTSSDAIIASGYTPVSFITSYTLQIEGVKSKFTLDSIKFEQVDEEYFSKYLCWERTDKNYNDKSFNYSECAFKDDFCYHGNINYFGDVVVDRNKVKKILGLTCYLASYQVDEVRFEAWFTEDLPFSDGPFGLDIHKEINIPLLPGLVMELVDKLTGSYYKAMDIVILPPSTFTNTTSCSVSEDVNSFDKLDHFTAKQERSIRLQAKDIILNKWYSAY